MTKLVVNIRIALRSRGLAFKLDEIHPVPAATATHTAELYGVEQGVPILKRSQLSPGQRLCGPVLITEKVSTLWIAPDWNATVDNWGNILLEKK